MVARKHASWQRLRADEWISGALAAALAGAALFAGTGLHPVWWLTWLAPLPVLAWSLRHGRAAAAACASAAWLAGSLNEWHYARDLIGLPLPVLATAVAVPAVAFALCVVLVTTLARQGRTLLAALALPTAWTAFEHIVAVTSPNGTFGSLAYTQMDAVAVLQITAFTGAAGVTFLVLLVPSAVAVWTLPIARRRRVAIAAAAIGVLGAAAACGALRLADDADTDRITIGLIASDARQPVPASSPAGRMLMERYLAAANALVNRGARVLVLPETTMTTLAPGALAPLQALADGRGVDLVAGVDALGQGREQNVAVLFRPAQPPQVYAKQHLLTVVEGRYTAGHERLVASTPRAAYGLAICKDLDFPRSMRAYGPDARLLLVPAWDFGVDGWLHSRMAVMRGIENGLPIARAARQGRLTLSDARGRVVVDVPSDGTPVASALGSVALGNGATFYTRTGDWFGWACVAGTALMCGLAIAGAFRRRPDAARRLARASLDA